MSPTPPDSVSASDDSAAARDRLGRAHQLRVDIAIAISLVPAWLKRALLDRNDVTARRARSEIVERIALAIEKRFRVTWHGSEDAGDNALPVESGGPLFGAPARPPAVDDLVDSGRCNAEHRVNI